MAREIDWPVAMEVDGCVCCIRVCSRLDTFNILGPYQYLEGIYKKINLSTEEEVPLSGVIFLIFLGEFFVKIFHR